MLVYFGVVVVKVLAELRDDGSVGQGDELGVDFVDAGSSERRNVIRLGCDDGYFRDGAGGRLLSRRQLALGTARENLLPYPAYRSVCGKWLGLRDCAEGRTYSSPTREALLAAMVVRRRVFEECPGSCCVGGGEIFGGMCRQLE